MSIASSDESFDVISRSPEETVAIGRSLGHRLSRGDVVGLSGDFGAGKTCFTRGIVGGLLGDDRLFVTSPSFVLLNRYDGHFPLFHFDCYRLKSPDEFLDAGFYDCVAEGAVVVEWADALPSPLTEGFLSVRFVVKGERERLLSFRATTPAHAGLVKDLRAGSANHLDRPSVCNGGKR